MMNFKNILVAYDSSGFSNRAFKSALDIAESDKSKITIVTVVTGIYQPSIGFSMKFNKDVLAKYNKILKKTFSNLQDMANKKNVKLSLKVLKNPSVSKAILNYMVSHKFDLIVIGSHGRTGFNQFLLGSVSNTVIQSAKCPVLIIK